MVTETSASHVYQAAPSLNEHCLLFLSITVQCMMHAQSLKISHAPLAL